MDHSPDAQLAIHGGPPTFPDGPPRWPTTTPEIAESIRAVVEDQSWGQYESPWLDQLCQALVSEFQVPFVYPCSSGTIAVELGLRGLGVRSGDEVVLSAYDFPGNFRAVEAIGAVPVLVDVKPGGWTLAPDQLAAAFSSQTAVVLASHLHGEIADLPAIQAEIAERKGARGEPVRLLEDNCQAPGGSLDGRPLGAWGDAATLSFGGSKLLTAGRGGALLTQDEAVLQRAKVFAERGNLAFPLSTLQAAALLPQLAALAEQTKIRAASVQRILSNWEPHPGLVAPPPTRPNSVPAYYKLPWRVADPGTRELLEAAFRAEGIAIASGFRGFHKRSLRRCRRIGTLDQARRVAERTLLLHHPILLSDPAAHSRLLIGMRKVLNGLSALSAQAPDRSSEADG